MVAEVGPLTRTHLVNDTDVVAQPPRATTTHAYSQRPFVISFLKSKRPSRVHTRNIAVGNVDVAARGSGVVQQPSTDTAYSWRMCGRCQA